MVEGEPFGGLGVRELKAPMGHDDDLAMAGSRYLALRWASRCVSCSAPLAAGTLAWWDADAKSTTCLDCQPEALASGEPVPSQLAGGSAQREYERRKANDEERVRDRHPHIGGFLLRVRDEPQHLSAWAKGAEGERRLGSGLDLLASESVRVLHDRRIPRSRANIDHLVVAPSGVYVIDAKRYKGKVQKRDKGGLFRTDLRLYVGSRDCSSLVAGMERQIEAVHDALIEGPTVHPVICFIDAEWGLFTKPFNLDGVLVCWPKALYQHIQSAGHIGGAQVADIASRLASALPTA